jgi:hypothetical protein
MFANLTQLLQNLSMHSLSMMVAAVLVEFPSKEDADAIQLPATQLQ